MCWSSGRAYGPPRRASCPSRSRSLVCKIPIALLGLSETNTIGYLGPYAPAPLYNGKELHSVTVLPLLPHWERFLGGRSTTNGARHVCNPRSQNRTALLSTAPLVGSRRRP